MKGPIHKAIAMVVLPFAGVAIGWYLFMPNMEWLRVREEYRSQAVLDLIHAQNIINKWRYHLFTPKETKNWTSCILKEGWKYLEASLYKDNKGEGASAKWTESITIDQYKLKKCGPKPLFK